ncbi:MAG: hypothetical protein WAJ85_05440 [Candidatus Baltobacteraceae bacterium]
MISFRNDPELGVFVCAHVDEGAPVLLALHESDASWTFLCGESEHGGEEPGFVHVHHLVDLDATVDEIAGVPAGHTARRDTPVSPWRVASISPRPAARP